MSKRQKPFLQMAREAIRWYEVRGFEERLDRIERQLGEVLTILRRGI